MHHDLIPKSRLIYPTQLIRILNNIFLWRAVFLQTLDEFAACMLSVCLSAYFLAELSLKCSPAESAFVCQPKGPVCGNVCLCVCVSAHAWPVCLSYLACASYPLRPLVCVSVCACITPVVSSHLSVLWWLNFTVDIYEKLRFHPDRHISNNAFWDWRQRYGVIFKQWSVCAEKSQREYLIFEKRSAWNRQQVSIDAF